MKNFRLIMVGIFVVLISVTLFLLDYQDLFSRSNLGNIFGIFSMLLSIIAMLLSNRHEAKNKEIRKPL